MDETGNKTMFTREELLRSVAYRLMLLTAVLALGVMILLSCSERERQSGEADTVLSPAPSARAEARFQSGVYVSGVDIGGLTEYEAAEKLLPVARDMLLGYECRLNCEGRAFTVDGDDVNLDTDMEKVLGEALDGGAGEYELSVFPKSDGRLTEAVAGIAEQIDRAPKQSRLVTRYEAERDGMPVEDANARFALTAPEDGVKVDTALAAELIAGGELALELPVDAVPAEENAPELPVRRAYFATSFASGGLSAPNRVRNIVRAASMLNGVSLAPGERLSCNAALGERTEERGWLPATAFASGGTETSQQAGGGICQVSTTLYNCALLAGLNVPERHSHSRRVSYVPGGRDAALNWGSADLVIENDTASRIYIYIWADEGEGKLFAEIYGGRFDGDYDEIGILSELIETVEPGEPEFIEDDELASGDCVLVRSAITGSRWATYRAFMKGGNELRRERVDETSYLMHPALYAVAPAGP